MVEVGQVSGYQAISEWVTNELLSCATARLWTAN